MHVHAQDALRHARGALSSAVEGSEGLSAEQQESLRKADVELEAATKKVEVEELAQTEWVKQTLKEADVAETAHHATQTLEAQLEVLAAKAAQATDAAEKAALEASIKELRAKLDAQTAAEAAVSGSGESLGKMEDEIFKMEGQVDSMEDIKTLRSKITGLEPESNAEEENLKKELAELKGMVTGLEGKDVAPEETQAIGDGLSHLKKSIAESISRQEANMQAKSVSESAAKSGDFEPLGGGEVPTRLAPSSAATPSSPSSAVEVDTEMPYGELEPFGREDTAAELTEASIRESDKMVDTIEKAEVAEEKRSVFRALTRLRGAAITSYDGVARSQTGNIDEYAHTHQWRNTHPLHHLADEESDVSKWAFPDNAD